MKAYPDKSMDQTRTSSPNLACFQAKYRYRNPLLRFANRRFLETIEALLEDIQFENLLDIGCGEGIVLDRIRRRFPCATMGLDLDPFRVGTATETLGRTDLLIGDCQSLPFRNEAFDLVLMLELLEHVGQPQLALEEALRVTRRYLLASVPREPWWRLGNMARLKYLRNWGNTPEHINHWTLPDFKDLISKTFVISEVRTPMLWTFVLAEKRG